MSGLRKLVFFLSCATLNKKTYPCVPLEVLGAEPYAKVSSDYVNQLDLIQPLYYMRSLEHLNPMWRRLSLKPTLRKPTAVNPNPLSISITLNPDC